MGSMDWPVEWEWNDLDGWAKALESKGISINIAPQLGQAALQVAALVEGAAVEEEGAEAADQLWNKSLLLSIQFPQVA